MRAGWSAASADWVETIVMGLSGNPFLITDQNVNPFGYTSCLNIIAEDYIGSVGNTAPLALVLAGVNGAKGRWLGGDANIAAEGNNLAQTANNIQEVRLFFSPPTPNST
jgi:hypothetical protein